MNTASIRRNPWPYALIAYFILFGTAMAAWIAYAVGQHQDLVRPDYYDEEIRYQQQIDRLNRTQAIRSDVRIVHDIVREVLLIALPADHARQSVQGRIQLYRPSDARLDRSVPLEVNAEGLQSLDTKTLRSGLWKVRVEWTVAQQDYQFDQTVVVGGH